MKREELPGFVRELPITILMILAYAVILAFVFSPIYLGYKKRAEERRARDAQEMTITDESPDDAPESADTLESNEDSGGSSD